MGDNSAERESIDNSRAQQLQDRLPWFHRQWGNISSNLSWEREDTWQELSGSMGDLGTFLPLLVALTVVNGLDLGTTLIATGLYNLVSGAAFGVPMPVQPQKSVAAIAITEANPMTVPQIMAAGMGVAAVTFLLGITGAIDMVNRAVPLSVVRGIQLALGISLASKGWKLFFKTPEGKGRLFLGLDSTAVSLLAAAFILLVSGIGDLPPKSSVQSNDEERNRTHLANQPASSRLQLGRVNSSRWRRQLQQIPTALVVVMVGICLTVAKQPSILWDLRLGPSLPSISWIKWSDWKVGLWRAAVPQIPLTLLNSVIAVCKLSSDLFPKKPMPLAPVAISVGVMNLIGCWFGAMPVCHGAGGLAAQYRFGARSGASVVFLGIFKVLLGLLFGGSLLHLLQHFPSSLLGALLLFAGLELAMTVRDQTSRTNSFLCFVTAVSCLASGTAMGFVVGLLVAAALASRNWLLDGTFTLIIQTPAQLEQYNLLPDSEEP